MTKTHTMAEVASALGGKLTGDGAYSVARVAHPADVRGPQDLALAADPALIPLLEKAGAVAAIIPEGTQAPSSVKVYVEVGRSRVAMSKLTRLFEEQTPVALGVHPMAVVEEGAILGKDVAIGALSYVCKGAKIGDGSVIHPQVYIGPDAEIGEGCLFYPGVRIGARVKIGARAILHFNTTIGADGFSYVTPEMGSVETAKQTGSIGNASNTQLLRIASLGSVVMGDDVEIGANTSVDSGTIVATRVGNGTKIDNQVQVGHNVQIGENCMLCGRVGIAGSAKIGNRVVLGGAVGVADHVTVGDDVVAMGMSGISSDIEPRQIIGGTPAKPRKKFIEEMYNIHRIKSLAQKISELTKRMDKVDGKPD